MARKSLYSVVISTVLSVLCLITTACKNENAPQQQVAPDMTALVTAEKVEEDFPEVTKKYVGVFEAIESVDVVARVSGRIIEANVEEGKEVEAGKQLFKIEDVTYVANVAAAEANVATCEANITSSEANLEAAKASVQQLEARLAYAATSYMRSARLYCGKNEEVEEAFKKLADPNVNCKVLHKMVDSVNAIVRQLEVPAAAVSKDTYESAASELKSAIASLESGRATQMSAQGALDSAKANLNAAKAKLDLANIDNDYTVVTSDIAGRVGRMKFTLGNFVTPASGALITVTQMDPIYVRFSMSGSDFAEMFHGKAEELVNNAQIELEIPGQVDENGTPIVFTVKTNEQGQNMLFIDNSVRTNMDSVYVWATFDNKDQLFNPGAICRVTMKRRLNEKCAFVRATAIQHDALGSFIYVVDTNRGNLVERRHVTLGPTRGTYQAVMPNEDPQKTLRVGEVVATSGTHKILMIPGMETRVNLGMPTGIDPKDTPLSVAGATGGATAPKAPQASATLNSPGTDTRNVPKVSAKNDVETKVEVDVLANVSAETPTDAEEK